MDRQGRTGRPYFIGPFILGGGSKNLQEKLHQGYLHKGCKNVKNAPKPSIKYFEDKICKIKQIKNIPVTRRTFSNQQKEKITKNLTLKRTP